MKFIGWTILQAEAKKFKGYKVIYSPKFGESMALFSMRETAHDYLVNLIAQINHEQSIGVRSADNLDPEKKLDFLIKKVEIDIDLESDDIKKKGWIIDPDDIVFEGEDDKMLKKVQENLKSWENRQVFR